MNLNGKCALVTGSSRGIGKAIALTLAEHGANIALNYVEDREGKNYRDAQSVTETITRTGKKVALFEADVGNYERVASMIDKVEQIFGTIDILINNAAILRDKTLKKMSRDEWDSVININLTGVFNCSHAVIEKMLKNGWGRIINIASISGQIGLFGQTNYSASKAGVMGFTKALAREVAAKNITVNAIAPGMVETEMVREIPPNVREEFLKQIPMGRFAQPHEIAESIVFLVSDKASYITGQVLHINGGWYM